MKTTLTDRYVDAVTRRLPAEQQQDVARELRATIEDTVDARDPQVTAEAAETAAVEQLGDPERLAAAYRNTPAHLIGPELYFDYRRLLTTLVVIIPAIVATVTVAAAAVKASAGPLELVGMALNTAFLTAVQVAFWVTLVFAVLERRGGADRRTARSSRAWTVDQLEDRSPREFSFAGTAVSLGWAVLAITALTLSFQTGGPTVTGRDGARAPLFSPDLWPGWVGCAVLVLVAMLALEVVKYRVGRWTWSLVVVNAVLQLAFVGPLLWLSSRDRILDPAGVRALGDTVAWDSAPGFLQLAVRAVVTVVVLSAVWSVGTSAVRAAQDSRGGRNDRSDRVTATTR